MAPPQVVVVGAGVTGSLLACLLKEMGVPTVRVVEKSRGAGGRMVTHRLRDPVAGGGRDAPVVGRADLGAQYVTTRSPPEHAVLGPLYKSLLDAAVLKPFEGLVAGPNPYGATAEVRHFAAPKGLQSIAEYFLQRSAAELMWDAFAQELQVLPDGGLRLKLQRGSDGAELPSISNNSGEEGPTVPTIVVLTQPVPQVLGNSKFPMSGNFLESLSQEAQADLGKVEFSSRFAAAYFFDAAKFTWPHAWTAHYFDKGDVRYVAHDSGKRGAGGDETMVSVLVHSGVPLGIELKAEEQPFSGAATRLQVDLEEKLPEIPWREAAAVKVHKWAYSQVYKGYGARRPAADWVWDAGSNGFPGCLELFRTEQALGLLAGDALAPASNFEGCVYSAHKAAEAVKAFVTDLQARSDL